MKRMTLLAAGLLLLIPAGSSAVSAKVQAGRRVPQKTTLVMLSTGSHPRRTLRYRFRKGQQVTMSVSMKMNLGMTLLGRQIPMQALPTMTMQLSLRVLGVSPGGNSTLSFVLSGITVKNDTALPAHQLRMLRAKMMPLKGFTGRTVITPRGEPLKITYKIPAAVTGQTRQIIQSLQQQMKQITAQLPAQPVGIGARWRVQIPVKGPPITFVNELTYQLVARQPGAAEMAVTVSGWAPPQAMVLPGMPASAGARLQSLTATGSGAMKIYLNQPKATGKMTLSQQVDAVLKLLGRSQPMGLNVSMKVHFR